MTIQEATRHTLSHPGTVLVRPRIGAVYGKGPWAVGLPCADESWDPTVFVLMAKRRGRFDFFLGRRRAPIHYPFTPADLVAEDWDVVPR